MLLLDNFVHADLHPGNIMIRFRPPGAPVWERIRRSPKGSTSTASADELSRRLRELSRTPEKFHEALRSLDEDGYQPILVLIDTGLATKLSPANRRNFLDLFRAVAEFDGYRAGHLMVERCRHPELVRDPETFALKLQHLVLGVQRATFRLGQIRIADVLGEVLKHVREHHVKLEGDFVDTVLSILLLEGIGRQLDPDMDLFKSALPILRQLGRQMNTTEAIRGGYEEGSLAPMLKVRHGHCLFRWSPH
jgi:aarF domain-containing kinase